MARDRSKHSGKAARSSRRADDARISSRPGAIPAEDHRTQDHPARHARARETLAPAPPFRSPASGIAVLYGFHTVREALRAGRRKILDIYVTAQAVPKLAGDIARAGLQPHIIGAEDLSRRLGAQAVHQGVMLEALPLAPVDLSDIETKSGVVLVLDQITDPHNIGAIVRTAAAFAVDAVVLTERHAPELAGVAAKAASGGLEHAPVVRVVNLARALEHLGKNGYQRLGLDSEAELSLADAPLHRPVALVLGAEDKGLRRLTREKCDFLVRLDMPGPIKSLNVSNACAVALTLLHARATRRG